MWLPIQDRQQCTDTTEVARARLFKQNQLPVYLRNHAQIIPQYSHNYNNNLKLFKERAYSWSKHHSRKERGH
jgi:hypothetical protein